MELFLYIRTVLGYWHSWLATVESNNYSVQYLAFSGNLRDMEGVEAACCVIVNTSLGPSPVPDVWTVGLANRKLIVSHKCTRNLFDLTSLWKRMVINQLERDALEPERNLIESSDNSLSDKSEMDLSYLFQIINYL